MGGPHRNIARLACLGLALAAGPASADDSTPDPERTRIVLTGGYGHSIVIYGIGALWPIGYGAASLARHGFDARLGTDIAWWDGRNGNASNRNLWDASVTPYLRWRPTDGSWQGAYVEIGVGLHLLSHTKINDGRDFGTAFQFGERLGIGWSFGARREYEITAFIQHVSNADMKKPNWGLTYYGATIGIPLD